MWRFYWMGWFVGLLMTAVPVCASDDDDDELPDFRPGLIGQYQDATGRTIQRVEPEVKLVAHQGQPDARLALGPFTVDFRGRLFAMSRGAYVLRVFAAGKVELLLGGRTIISATSSKPAWMAAEPVELDYGYHPLSIRYKPSPATAEIALYWSGPNFQLEPVADRYLFHDPKDHPDDSFERGRALARALRCDACHREASARPPQAAPALTRLSGNLEQDWLVDWLTASVKQGAGDDDTIARRMPHFALSRADAEAIAAYLFSDSESQPSAAPPKPARRREQKNVTAAAKPPAAGKKNTKKPKPRTEPSAAAGEALLDTVGCLACHELGNRGTLSLFGGGDLTTIASKRPADFFARWLTDPAATNPSHRMPVFPLSDLERGDLALYLATLKSAGSKSPSSPADANRPAASAKQREHGRQLVGQYGCAACHKLPENVEQRTATIVLGPNSRWSGGCLAPAKPGNARPSYAVSAGQRAQIESYYRGLAGGVDRGESEGSVVLAERNCLACHVRGTSAGIAPSLERLTAARPELAARLPALAPPALIGVGDKLHDEALAAAILLKRPPLRPWLDIRMPRFPLSSAEMQSLVRYFVDQDRMPPLQAAKPVDAEAQGATVLLAGSRLVTADGFGCTSCHQIGRSEPQAVALAAHGADLSLVGQRIRQAWFDRWVRNPARIVPRMEMPAIQQPVRGVLHSQLDTQLAAVWQALNTPGFDPPQPNPIRVVRSTNSPGADPRANLLTDVLEMGSGVFLKPLVIGLANRHNVLFDLERGQLAGWWLGDTGRERTRGKSWFWEAGAVNLLPAITGDGGELTWQRDGRHVRPQPSPQFVAELDRFQHTPSGIRWSYRLSFDDRPGGSKKHVLFVEQTIALSEPAADGKRANGFRRRVEVRGAASGKVWLRLLPGEPVRHGMTLSLDALPGQPRATVLEPSSEIEFDGTSIALAVDKDESRFCKVLYRIDLPPDEYVPPPPVVFPTETVKLNVVPGYDAEVLPLASDEMPTGLAWRPDGTLVFSSLKGRVCLARDTNGDGLEDTIVPISDDLAAPYGVACQGEAIDVSNKYGLLRLTCRDDRAERTDVLASGWGYTTDYHDWAVGLPRDAQGCYYVALPCQQDDRSLAAARLRGEALRLVPRSPTADNPRLFDVQPIAAGLRFPMGLALNTSGDLFATDNQGNYTPFNELNHLVAGKRYGFINKLDVRPGYTPPYSTAAVEIPHPWARSTNGICFLYTPDAVRERLGRSLFGPFEGHLLGCEYTTVRLVRMSLERVGDAYQGAVYPFSRVPAAGEANFEGPVVCAVAPDGDVYVGNMHDSAWGGGRNTGSIARLRPKDALDCGLAEVRATASGFTLEFTQPLSAAEAGRAGNYSLVSFRRIATPAYGGSDIDRQPSRVRAVRVSPDRRSVSLEVEPLRPGFVYEFQLRSSLAPGGQLFPAEAYYTLRQVPR